MNTQCFWKTLEFVGRHAPAKSMWFVFHQVKMRLFHDWQQKQPTSPVNNICLVWNIGCRNSLWKLSRNVNHTISVRRAIPILPFLYTQSRAPDLEFIALLYFGFPWEPVRRQWLGSCRHRVGTELAEGEACSKGHGLVKDLSSLGSKYEVGFSISGFGFVLLLPSTSLF